MVVTRRDLEEREVGIYYTPEAIRRDMRDVNLRGIVVATRLHCDARASSVRKKTPGKEIDDDIRGRLVVNCQWSPPKWNFNQYAPSMIQLSGSKISFVYFD
jgi:hypothetical protein